MPIRTICVPIAECLSHSKSEFYRALRESLDASRTVANVAASECLRQDDFKQEKLGKIYTYPAVKDMYQNASFMLSSVCRAVEASYRQDRWDVVRGRKSTRSYRSQPWPMLNNKSCSTFRVEDCGEFIALEIKLLDGKYRVRLAGGSSHRDQIAGIKNAMALNTIKDSKVWVDRKHRAIIGFCVELPIAKRDKQAGTVRVASGVDYLVGMMFERSAIPYVINADDVIFWKAESVRRNQRFRQSRKQGVDRRNLLEQSNAFAAKMSSRLKTKIHQVSSDIVKKAVREGVECLVLDLTIKSFCKSFPWFDLASAIKYKCEMHGIAFSSATLAVTDPSIENPHVYFKYAPATHRVKIGQTQTKKRHGSETDSSEELCILAVDNQPKSKLLAKEKFYHAMFAHCRVNNANNTEWFNADPVLEFLRQADWLGNAGNLSQIAQYLDVTNPTSRDGLLQADRKCLPDYIAGRCSQNADKRAGILGANQAAPAVTKSMIKR